MSQTEDAKNGESPASSAGVDRTPEKDRNSKQKSSSSTNAKSKDLSHVPCKFFKVGSCTAGPSCPFSHQSLEPGQHKDVCAWFVKGNCKFGHKCALAHILPGQTMGMDRRNKKAAQVTAGGNANGKDKDREGGRTDNLKSTKSSQRTGGASSLGLSRGNNAQVRNTLLSGPTAPTRMLPPGARPPMSMSISKAAPAPPATAPVLDDTDFTTFGTEKATETKTEQDLRSPSQPPAENEVKHANVNGSKIPDPTSGLSPNSGASLIPVSTPTEPIRFTGRHGASPSMDFGPVGSPPRASPSNPIRINGFSPGTSPRGDVIRQPSSFTAPTSTFSAPGPSAAPSLFVQYDRGNTNANDYLSARSGLARSLGAMNAFDFASSPTNSMSYKPSVGNNSTFSGLNHSAESHNLDEDDMEEFVPSSLNDLLTPEEQMRRMTRATSNRDQGGVGLPRVTRTGTVQQDGQHRHSRSVPAQSILQDIRSIWAEPSLQNHGQGQGAGSPIPGAYDKDQQNQHLIAAGIGIGTPPSSSFKANSLLRSFDDGPSPSMLAPSNASAAFLPSLHQQFMSRGGGITSPGLRSTLNSLSNTNTRSVSHGNGPPQLPSGLSQDISLDLAQGNHPSMMQPLSFSSYSQLSPGASQAGSRDPSFSHQHSQHPQHATGRPIPSSNTYASNDSGMFSPSTRALHAHAPGQSLPQGLAAGFSRIHLQGGMNLSPGAFSPGTVGVGMGSPPSNAEMENFHGNLEWRSLTPLSSRLHGHMEQVPEVFTHDMDIPAQTPSENAAKNNESDSGAGALSSMFSRMSYSAATARGTPAVNSTSPSPVIAPKSPAGIAGGGNGNPTNDSPGLTPMSAMRKGPTRAWNLNAQPFSSPLSEEVAKNDEEDLFFLDEEK